ncbi:glucosamine-6-phosphate deaminase [Aquibacillus salsiterrae]|uniref:Glucosamine-6-phosphate deaminase n=1 Tax=Aquibacillus salsiterrae TaxID=2950439 RepID=A0A9X4AHT6_9BACI|nr:glucosamine-6-phosphate deaminase [Aquibacillus salsiterrae]MDC3418568.1 glucosamine-6-phosphate deaminase [Aquibacillus salsiterrae]
MKLISAKNYSDMSQVAASFLLGKIKNTDRLTLGLATGGTPIQTYNFLIKDHKENNTSYQHVTTFNLDEYVGVATNDPRSYHHYMDDMLFTSIDIPKTQTHIPDGVAGNLEAECDRYEQKIAASGGIDVQLLGLGSNGHIGFNEPGTAFDTKTHVVDLTEATRKANARFFDHIDEVPKQAITMGIATIMRSKEILLLVSGERKSNALAQLLEGKVDPAFPASILREHPNVSIIADHDALGDINVPVRKGEIEDD